MFNFRRSEKPKQFREMDVVRLTQPVKGIDSGMGDGTRVNLHVGTTGTVQGLHWNLKTGVNEYDVEFTDKSGMNLLARATLPIDVLELHWSYESGKFV